MLTNCSLHSIKPDLAINVQKGQIETNRHKKRMYFSRGASLSIALLLLCGRHILYNRPAQLAELPRSEFDPELFPHIAYVDFFCDIRDKSAVFNIL